MKTIPIYIFYWLIISCTILSNVRGQSVGFTFNYSTAYSRVQENFGFQSEQRFYKSPGYAIGIVLNENLKLNTDVHVRLASYSINARSATSGFAGFTYSNVTVDKLVLELEAYSLSKRLFDKVYASLGTKFSLLLRSNVDGYTSIGTHIENASSTQITSRDYEGIRKFLIDVHLKFSWNSIQVSDDIFVIPSYIFGYGWSGELDISGLNTTSFTHRFEVGIHKKLKSK